jgi:transcriptional regulator with XRE-family HTH domain
MSDNGPMEKGVLRQILARNLRQAMEIDPNIDTQEKLASKSGLSQSHISRILLCEAASTTDALAALAKAVKCQPFELLTDTESTRRAALERMLARDGVPDLKVELPQKVTAMRRKKRGT